ncbi:MAG: GTPase HflX [Planctomycetota bacterium]|nr:GTPase HflX [Planctomycetota bacterium]
MSDAPELGDLGSLPSTATAVLFAVLRQGPTDVARLDELASLCGTAGIEPVDRLVQVRHAPSPSGYLGRGKVVELAECVRESGTTLAVCDEELSPVQGRVLEQALEVRVIDRSELILAIFAARAHSAQARLQVELAQRRYQLPRLKRLWTHLDRERGGKGFLGGMGEKQIDVDRRLLSERIRSLRRRLDDIEARRQREVESRSKEFLVSLVGYTNAGKSTLMNRLTGAGVLEEDRLFTTLDTRTRRWELGEGRGVLLSDTVGFIRRIPHNLVASFHATLTEAVEANLLLVVVDASDPDAKERIATVNEVLDDIGADTREKIVVLNKVDAADVDRLVMLRNTCPDAVAVSARTGIGAQELADRVQLALDKASIEVWLCVPHALSAVHNELRTAATVLEVRYADDAAFFRVRATPATLGALGDRGVTVSESPPPAA